MPLGAMSERTKKKTKPKTPNQTCRTTWCGDPLGISEHLKVAFRASWSLKSALLCFKSRISLTSQQNSFANGP